jgi:hypothetical protein
MKGHKYKVYESWLIWWESIVDTKVLELRLLVVVVVEGPQTRIEASGKHENVEVSSIQAYDEEPDHIDCLQEPLSSHIFWKYKDNRHDFHCSLLSK